MTGKRPESKTAKKKTAKKKTRTLQLPDVEIDMQRFENAVVRLMKAKPKKSS